MYKELYDAIAKDFNAIGKVYLVWCDNGEMYEDSFSYVETVFNSKSAAEKYLDDRHERGELVGYKGERQTWSDPKFVCSMNNMNCEDCPRGGLDNGYCCALECDEYEERMDSEWDNSFWYIEEMDLWG